MRLPDTMDPYELRGAHLQVARKPYPCDVFECGRTIRVGDLYVKLSVGLRWCAAHLTFTENDQ